MKQHKRTDEEKMRSTYRYRFTSTLRDLLEAEEADMTANTIQGWMRWTISFIGLVMIVTGLLELGSLANCWIASLRALGGCFLLYYFLIKSYVRRFRIRKNNDASQELVLEFCAEYLRIEASGQGTFRREWNELYDFKDAARGVLLYFDDGIINWLPNRVFEDRAEKTALVEFLLSHTS